MSTPPKVLQQAHLPQLRTNKHFRIKSASKEKILMGGELLTTRTKRKSSIDDAKRIFSEHKNKKSGSIDSCIKIRITKEELIKKFDKKPSSKKFAYESVKTDGENGEDTKLATHLHLNTITHDAHLKALQRMANSGIPQRIISKERLDHLQKEVEGKGGEERRKEGTTEKEKGRTAEKEHKGKYRCRVNQYIFDHSRKKSNHCSKEQQETIDEFWKNVNESMILGGQECEEVSKDLREFVEHFQTE